MLDPFTQIHYAVWRALVAYSPWAKFVPQGARVNAIPAQGQGDGVTGINAKPLLIKMDALEPGDTPEVRIVQRNGGRDPKRDNSMIRSYFQDYMLQMSTSSKLLDQTPQNQLKYLTDIALFRATPNLGIPQLIREWDYTHGQDMPAEKESGLKMWISVVPVTVYFFKNKSELVAP